MKKVLFLLVCVMGLASCRVNFNGDFGKIKPSDNIVKVDYRLASFDKVEIRVVSNVMLIQDSVKSGLIEFSAPDNYIDLFAFESEDGKLEVDYTESNVNIEQEHVIIKVYTSDLQDIKNKGAANVALDGLVTDGLVVENSGVGNFNLVNLKTGSLVVRCSGVGNITLGGETKDATLSCSGVGSIHAKEMKAENVEARVTGVGNIDCHASESIDGKVTGVGSLKYAGSPQHKNLNHNFTGNISEI